MARSHVIHNREKKRRKPNTGTFAKRNAIRNRKIIPWNKALALEEVNNDPA